MIDILQPVFNGPDACPCDAETGASGFRDGAISDEIMRSVTAPSPSAVVHAEKGMRRDLDDNRQRLQRRIDVVQQDLDSMRSRGKPAFITASLEQQLRDLRSELDQMNRKVALIQRGGSRFTRRDRMAAAAMM